jgi:alanyl-tRNA synthetase
MTGNEIREKFLGFFQRKGHTRVESSSLVPYQDPTLLFTNAGMNQFKDVFLGLEKRPYVRAVTSQKCVRAGGKHNDLDTVGRTARHHTFFEMLGNFSCGDYFKKEAIQFAWEFLTVELGLPPEKLYITVYQDDDEAAELWRTLTSVPEERIVRLGEKDNFWAMGDTGPCGPCSEIMFDRGEKYACGPDCGIGKCDCDRYLEIWNLVFMQYNRDGGGEMTPLPRPSIDTGMGLERVTSVIQDVATNYDTDLLKRIIERVEELSGKTYFQDQRGFPFRVVADHIRACCFLIGDGVLPGNEGRGYVLRRILRRAVRFGRELGIEGAFMHRLAPVVAELMGEAYPVLIEKQAEIVQAVFREEERFQETLAEGIRMARDIMGRLKEDGADVLPGDDMFRLYDTYGFPMDLSRDMAEEAGLRADAEGFERAMEAQRRKAREARRNVNVWDLALNVTRLVPSGEATVFVGYGALEADARIQALLCEGELIRSVNEGALVQVVCDRTPFYAESGGQVSDQGRMEGAHGFVGVEQVVKLPDGRFVHQGTVSGQIRAEETLTLKVDAAARQAVCRNHTATHLLHEALRDVLGSHAQQAGSLVNSDRLRFDFNHFEAMTSEETVRAEARVNEAILAALPVVWREMSQKDALEKGATALFGEKYGDTVRVVEIGDRYSQELCGGTHVSNTSHIGSFKIISESAVASGVRRIEGTTALGVLKYLDGQEGLLRRTAALLKAPVAEIPRKVQALMEDARQARKSLAQAEARMGQMASEDSLDQARTVAGVKVLAVRVAAKDQEQLRSLADVFRDKLGSGILALGAAMEDKAAFVVTVSKDLTARGVHAGNLIREIAKAAGGGGGGRPDMAQAGGAADRLDEALAGAYEIIGKALEG